jgi:hypothetical protein
MQMSIDYEPKLGQTGTMQIEMSADEAQEFASWLRDRGNLYLQRADRIIHAGSNGIHPGSESVASPPSRTITQDQFEESVAQKTGRVYDLARRLGVEESAIKGFMAQPNSRVEVGDKGWLRIKSQTGQMI